MGFEPKEEKMISIIGYRLLASSNFRKLGTRKSCKNEKIEKIARRGEKVNKRK